MRRSVPRGTLRRGRPLLSAAGLAEARELLDRGLAELDLHVTSTQRDRLLELAALLERWSVRINLTGHRGLEAIVHRLVLDAAALLAELPAPPSVADLGSGAGFPGLPAAILWPGTSVTLVESRERRHHFQRAACRALELSNARPLRGRAEALEASEHALVVAQAMAQPTEALHWMIPWATAGGLLALPGALEPPFPQDPRVELVRVARYCVPCGGPSRTLWVGRRVV